MMKNKFVLIRYVLMLWMLCGASYTLSIASAYDRNTSSQGWGYRPLQTSSSTTGYTASYGGTTTRGRVAERPNFHFQSTSVLISPSDMERMQMRGGGVVLMGDPWTDDQDPTEPGMGELVEPEEVDMPVGDVPWLFLLLLITAYYLIKRCSLLHSLGGMPTSREKTRAKTVGDEKPHCSAISCILRSGCSFINRFASSMR